MSVAKPLMSEVFRSTLPDVVTPSFSSNFVIFCSLGSLMGRILWAIISDYMGRKSTFAVMTFLNSGIYFAFPFLVNKVI